MIESGHSRLSIARQCELISISRSSFYFKGKGESDLNLHLMRQIDEQFLETPYYGSRQMARHLRRQGYCVGRKRVRRPMGKMELAVIYQQPRTSEPHPENRIYPYLLREQIIERPDHVWCADITYIPMRRGFLYLVAIMDRASQFTSLDVTQTLRDAASRSRWMAEAGGWTTSSLSACGAPANTNASICTPSKPALQSVRGLPAG